MTKPLRAEDYQELGRKDAREGGAKGWGATPRSLTPGSWQYRNWKTAYDAERERLQARAQKKPGLPPIANALAQKIVNDPLAVASRQARSEPRPFRIMDPATIASLTQGYPGAAGHHVGLLVELHNKESDDHRRRRLHRAVVRVIDRHMGGPGRLAAIEKEIRNFPVSTQPHPDGPITVGHLLDGR